MDTVSHLHLGDEHLHYEDGSHRWIGGDGTAKGDQAWRDRVQTHKDAHLAGKGNTATWWPGRLQQRPKHPGDSPNLAARRIPAPRRAAD